MTYLFGHLAYWLITGLMMIGLYTLINRHNLIKKLAGLSVFQTSAVLFYVSLGKVQDGTVPIAADNYELYANPLPQVLMLTAIVVGVATTALGFALIIRIQDAYDTVEEDEIQQMDEAEK